MGPTQLTPIILLHYNHSSMLKEFKETTLNECYLDPEKPILIGLSGGPDSICMLDLFKRNNFKIISAHLDHGMRENSRDDVEFVKKVSHNFDVPLTVETIDVQKISKLENLSLEEAGRIMRYRFLFKNALKFNCQAVAVGHNADDQVETLLMHLIRGSGLAGLCGMEYFTLPNPWSQDIPLIRPLLEMWRDEILNYLDELNIPVLIDPSNQDVHFFRNRIRLELVPYLEKLNPGVRKNLFQTSRILQSDFDFISTEVDSAWNSAIYTVLDNQVTFNLLEFNQQPENIRSYLVQRAYFLLRPDKRDLNFHTTRRAIQFVAETNSVGQVDLAGGLRIVLDNQYLHIAEWEIPIKFDHLPYFDSEEPILLKIPGDTSISRNWMIRSTLIDHAEFLHEKTGAIGSGNTVWFDFGQVTLPLIAKGKQPGERIQPMGLSGNSQKVSDIFIDSKVPRDVRDHYPIILSDEGIIWIPGLRRSNKYLITETTRNILRMELRRK